MCFKYLIKTIINVLSSVSCKLDTRIPNKFWPYFFLNRPKAQNQSVYNIEIHGLPMC